ncbi:MAG: hypothetical protein O7A09_04195, partial [Proteobacteria bacterium]|nr:hypothetical protein [Pseudomonadota bacterium]
FEVSAGGGSVVEIIDAGGDLFGNVLDGPEGITASAGMVTVAGSASDNVFAIDRVTFFPECGDGHDNDGDGMTDFPDDPGCADAAQDDESPECDDGIDNDLDTFTDLDDPSCTAATVDAEESECTDGEDNDGDLAVDFPADPGCTSAADISEEHDCQDGVDNDRDGRIDDGEDPGCTGPTDPMEIEPGLVCDDGIDNDGDTLVDTAEDPGCRFPEDLSEIADCKDGLDNDNDNRIDWNGGGVGLKDLGCNDNPNRQSEVSTPGCGLGPGLLGLSALGRLRRRKAARTGA